MRPDITDGSGSIDVELDGHASWLAGGVDGATRREAWYGAIPGGSEAVVDRARIVRIVGGVHREGLPS